LEFYDISVAGTEAGPYGIATGPDGALWCTEITANQIGRIDADHQVTEYPIPIEGAFPSAIVAGPDGAMWFTLNQANAIGRIETGTDGTDGSGGLDGTAGSDDGDGDGDGDLRITVYPLPTPGAAPVGITAGADGALWFVEIGAGQLGRISAGASAGAAEPAGTITEFPLPDRAARPHAVAVGPDGALWFTEWGANSVGRFEDGEFERFALPTAASEPHGLVAGPDGAVWVALENGALARIGVPSGGQPSR
jgi:virginiamycin B lyase